MNIDIAKLLSSFDLNKPFFNFLLEMFRVVVITPDRHCFRQLARYCRYEAHTLGKNFRKAFDFKALNFLILQVATREGNRIAAIDATFLPKSGWKTWGLAKFWSGCDSKTKLGLELSVLSIVDCFQNQAFTLSARQTPAQSNQEESRIDFYLSQVEQAIDCLRKLLVVVLVADGFYAKIKFVTGVSRLGLELISKLRKDARLKYLYTGEKTGKKGRPQKFDGYFNPLETNRLEKVDLAGLSLKGIEGFTARLWSVSLKRNIRVLLLRPINAPQKYVLLFSTNDNQEPQKIVSYYHNRFLIEFTFRDAKQNLGLGDCQSTREDAQSFHHQLTLTALNIVKTQNLHPETPNQTFSIQNAQRRAQNQFLLEKIFEEVGQTLDFALNSNAIANILNIGTIQSRAA